MMTDFHSIADILEQYDTQVQDILISSNMFNIVFYAGVLIILLAGVLFVDAVRKRTQERSAAPWLKYVALGLGILLAVPGAIAYDKMLSAPHLDFAEAQRDLELEQHVIVHYDAVSNATLVDMTLQDDNLISTTMELTLHDDDEPLTVTVDMVPEDDILVPADDDILQ